MTDTNNYICICTSSFEGDHCQFSKRMVNVKIVLSSNSTLTAADAVASTVSYSDYHISSLIFDVRHQKVYGALPSHLKLIYSDKLIATNAPTIAVMKIYGRNYYSEEPIYYVLYYYPDEKEINITTDLTSENHCPFVQTLWPSIQAAETSSKLGCFYTNGL
jgi:hypothetical protein